MSPLGVELGTVTSMTAVALPITEFASIATEPSAGTVTVACPSATTIPAPLHVPSL